MATVPNKSYKDLIPIRFILEDPDRSLDLSIPNEFASQQIHWGCSDLKIYQDLRSEHPQ